MKKSNEKGLFGKFGGSYVPEVLQSVLDDISENYRSIKDDPVFVNKLNKLRSDYTGRPTPIYFAENLSRIVGGAKIYLKREDLLHTGAHKINHCLGEALLAKHMQKTKLIAETGAGQHGVALATAAALVGLKCDIYMGSIDIAKEKPNVNKMRLLGAKVIPVTSGTKTLKDAVDAAFEAYLLDTTNQFYAIGSVVGPHPFPTMVRDFQKIIGLEAKEQMLNKIGKLPDELVACVGGGSNAIGLFSAFLDDDVNLNGIEPAGISFKTGEHAATLSLGSPGIIHGFKCILLQNPDGTPAPVYSVASGLDYPGVGPEHSYLHEINRVKYSNITDDEAISAFHTLSQVEGIIPALESAHAIAYAIKLAKKLSPEKTILVNLSGRGDKDMDFVLENYQKR